MQENFDISRLHLCFPMGFRHWWHIGWNHPDNCTCGLVITYYTVHCLGVFLEVSPTTNWLPPAKTPCFHRVWCKSQYSRLYLFGWVPHSANINKLLYPCEVELSALQPRAHVFGRPIKSITRGFLVTTAVSPKVKQIFFAH